MSNVLLAYEQTYTQIDKWTDKQIDKEVNKWLDEGQISGWTDE